jgi:glc operon protein GlcG
MLRRFWRAAIYRHALLSPMRWARRLPDSLSAFQRTHPIMITPRILLAFLVTAFAPLLRAQSPAYGAPIPLTEARRVLAAAQAEASKNNWNVVVAIVDSGGHLVALERMDTTQYGSVEVALEKARSAAAFRRPSKAFQDGVAAGGEGLRLLKLAGAMPIEGGLPLVSGGKIVGAIGISGVTSAQDGQIAAAGAAVLK